MMRFGMLAGLALILAGCGGSSNPFGSLSSANPFGGGSKPRTEVAADGEQRVVFDASVLSPSLDAVTPEPALRGLIIRVAATAPTQGYHSPVLRARNRGIPNENGIVTLEFRVTPPEFSQGLGPARTRQLVAATFFSDGKLDRIRGFRIVTQNNVVNVRR